MWRNNFLGEGGGGLTSRIHFSKTWPFNLNNWDWMRYFFILLWRVKWCTWASILMSDADYFYWNLYSRHYYVYSVVWMWLGLYVNEYRLCVWFFFLLFSRSLVKFFYVYNGFLCFCDCMNCFYFKAITYKNKKIEKQEENREKRTIRKLPLTLVVASRTTTIKQQFLLPL